jgi:threonine dehydrogenase-like Zn-dependent dehydrogenase
MKVLQYAKPHEAAIAEDSAPEIGAKQALGRNVVSNVSAGTEMAFYRGTAPQINSNMRPDGLWEECPNAMTYPMASNDPACWWMGYASVVEIVEVGSEFEGDLKVGDVVFTPQGHKEYQVIDAGSYQHIPEGVSPEQASFKSLMEIGYNGFLDAEIKLLDNVVIFGLGTIGQLLVRMCKLAGAKVIAIDYLDSRLELAKAGGADAVINPANGGSIAESVFEIFPDKADSVFEVSGNSKALHSAVSCIKKDGQVTVLSFYQQPPADFLMGQEFHHNRVVIRSSQIGGISPRLSHQFADGRRAGNAMELLSKIDVTPLISHRCSFDEYPDMIKTIDNNPSETLSVIIDYAKKG